MPISKHDLTNPRFLLSEIHRIIVGRGGWESRDVRKLSRWVGSKTWTVKSVSIFERLTKESIQGVVALFPIHLITDTKFISNKGVHEYIGQFFQETIFCGFHYSFKPFLLNWIIRHNNSNQSNDFELAAGKCLSLLASMIEFEQRFRTQELIHQMVFNSQLGSYWFLPTYCIMNKSESRMIRPVERLLLKIQALKDCSSRNQMVFKAVRNYESEDQKEWAYWRVEKSLDRLSKGEILTLSEVQQLRKVSFSNFIVDDHWESRTESDKGQIINELSEVYHPTPMSEKELERFNASWRKMYDDQNKYIKDSADGIYELGLIMAFLISRVIIDLQKYDPKIGKQFAELHP